MNRLGKVSLPIIALLVKKREGLVGTDEGEHAFGGLARFG